MKLLDRVNQGNSGETSIHTAAIMTYELGDMMKMLVYRHNYKNNPNRVKGYMIEAKIALSDLLAQCHVICEREGWVFSEIESLGIERLHERIDRRIRLGE